MLVSAFMTKADKVVTCSESESIGKIVSSMLENNISSVVVLADNKPVGLITKTDLILAYQQGLSTNLPVGEIATKTITTVKETQNRDQVASAMEHENSHHAIVVDNDGTFVGLVSSWDVVAECARDARAWPWTRTPDGRAPIFHPLSL